MTGRFEGQSFIDPTAMEPNGEVDADVAETGTEKGSLRRSALKWTVSTVAVIGFCAAASYAYLKGPDQGGETIVPVIMAKAGEIKEKPNNPGGAKIPHRDKTVYETIETADKKELKKAGAVPAPEETPTKADTAGETKTEKKPDEKSTAANDGGSVKPTAGKGDGVEPKLNTPPVAKTSVGKAPTDIHGRPDPKAAKKRLAAKKPKRRNIRRSAGAPKRYAKPPYAVPARGLSTVDIMGPYRVQLGSYRSPVTAQRRWFALKRRHRDVLGPLYVVIERINLGPRGVRYRLQAGPLQNANDAQSLCSALAARRTGCILVKG